VSTPSQGFRRLALATVAATDSGLGCGPGGSGFHGWPLCRGNVIPGASIHTFIEYSHRTVASAVAILMLALAALAWRRYRTNRAIVRASFAAALLVLAQGLLGAATVEKDLSEPLVAAHLGLAMMLLALAIYIWRASRPGVAGAEPVDGGPRFRPLAVASSGLVFCTIVAGGYMAGTQHYGRPDYHLGDGAHHACGKEFPACNGSFLPFGKSRLVDIHLTHRVFMYLTVIAVVALVVMALRRRVLTSWAWGLLGILFVQVLLGALNVWLDEYEALIVAHLAVATVLWGAVVGLTLQLYRVPAPVPARRHAAEAEAVPA
jgi:heme A synthase